MDNTIRKRRRPAVACTECRRRKVKCDRTLPCTSCFLGTLTCTYNLPIIPTQNSGPPAGLVTDTGSDWNLIPSLATPDSNLQKFYGNRIDSSETTMLNPHDTNHRGLDTVSNTRNQAIVTGSSGEGLDVISGLFHGTNTSSPSPSVQDGTNSTKSNLSRGTHRTPNHWKNIFREVCRKYHHFANFIKLISWRRFDPT